MNLSPLGFRMKLTAKPVIALLVLLTALGCSHSDQKKISDDTKAAVQQTKQAATGAADTTKQAASDTAHAVKHNVSKAAGATASAAGQAADASKKVARRCCGCNKEGHGRGY